MAFTQIAGIAPNYRDYKNWWLKAYEPGTTTPKLMSDNDTGSPTSAKYELNKDGFIISSGGTLIIPHVDGDYDLWLFPTAAEADANDTTNAERLADDLSNYLTTSNIGESTFVVFDTKEDAQQEISQDGNKVNLSDGGTIYIKDYYDGKSGGSKWDVVLTSSVTPNDVNIVQLTSNPTLSIVQIRGGSFDVEIPDDFPTLQSAIDFYMSSDIYADFSIDLWIADGHLLEGGIGCFHDDFSRFRVRSRNNATVKLSPTFAPPSTGGIPAGVLGETPRPPFLVAFDAKAPQIWALIDMENSATLGTGLQICEGDIFVSETYGVINAGFRGIQVHGRANIYAANFSGATGSGIRLQQASSCCARSAVADNCCKTEDLATSAVYVSRSSTLEFRGGSAQNSGAAGLIARRSIVTADEANFSNAADKGVIAENCAQVSFASGQALGCVSNAIRSISNANVNAVSANLSTTTSADNLNVDTSGVITISGSTMIEGVAATEEAIASYSNLFYTNSFNGAGMIFFDDGNGTFKITSNSDGISQRFADGRMLTFINVSVDTGTVASSNFSNQLTMPTQPDTFVSVDGSSMEVIGRTKAGGGGSRVCINNHYRPSVLTGNAWRVYNTGQQLDSTGTSFNIESVNLSMITYGTWR